MRSSPLEQMAQLPEKPHLLDAVTSLEKSAALLTQRLSIQFHKLVRRANEHNEPISSGAASCLTSLLACRDAVSHLQRTGVSQLQQMLNASMPLPQFSERYPLEWLETNNMFIAIVERDLESIYIYVSTSREADLPPGESESFVRKCTTLLWMIEEALAALQWKVMIQTELVRLMSDKPNTPYPLQRHASLSGWNRLETELLRVTATPNMAVTAAPLLRMLQRIRGFLPTNEAQEPPVATRVSSPPGKIWFNRNLPPRN